MSMKWILMMAAASPKENQNQVLNAGLTAGLPMSQRNRALFTVTQANNQANEHRRELLKAERTIGNTILNAVDDIIHEGLDTDSDDFKKRYNRLESLGLTSRLEEVVVSNIVDTDDDVVLEELSSGDAANLVSGLALILEKKKLELTSAERKKHPALSVLLQNDVFAASVEKLLEFAR